MQTIQKVRNVTEYAKACNVEPADMAKHLQRDPLAREQFNTWLKDEAVDRAFPCRACKGAGSCSVCRTL